MTAHDGFTLRDLVSYDRKHNEANGERQPRRLRQQPVLELWRRGRDRRRGDPRAAAPAGRQPDRDPAACPTASRCSRPATSGAAPSAATTTPTARTTRSRGWTGARTTPGWTIYEITRTALRIRREHPALRQRHWFEGRPAIVGGPKDLAWIHPTGARWTGDDWDDTLLHVIGMFVSGDPLRDPGPRGEQQHDSSFLLWLNARGRLRGHAARERRGSHRYGAVALSTDPDNPIGTEAHAGGKLVDPARGRWCCCSRR